MLIRFEVENFRSIREPAELSMVAIDADREGARSYEKLDASLLSTVGIFGPNASGKSNVLAALWWLSRAVKYSLSAWDDGIPVEPFAFGDGRVRDSSFAVELLVDGVRFEYLLDLNSQQIQYEALFHYPEGRRRRIFQRDEDGLILQRGLGQLSGARALLTPRSLALSIMRRFEEPTTASFAYGLQNMTSLGRPLLGRIPIGSHYGGQATLRVFEDGDQRILFASGLDGFDEGDQPGREEALALLRLADLGVVNVEIEEETINSRDVAGRDEGRRLVRRRPKLVHSVMHETVPFPYRDESEGTRVWFELIGPVLTALRRGGIVLFDELDASLHPTLTAQLVQLFQGRGSNPAGAQLIFTSHDVSLLNRLNRDEVWLTQKQSDGGTRLGALSDFAGERVRSSQNLQSGYLSGRFGALPDVAKPDLMRDLGLIG